MVLSSKVSKRKQFAPQISSISRMAWAAESWKLGQVSRSASSHELVTEWPAKRNRARWSRRRARDANDPAMKICIYSATSWLTRCLLTPTSP